MTESTQLQTTENNNAGLVKMEPPPPTPSSSTSAAANTNSTSPLPPTAFEQLQVQQQQQREQQQREHKSQSHLLSSSQSQQQYALKWNDFQTSILNSFRHLRDEEDFVDVTLACDQRSFTAHKVVLSACSPYFRKLLKANPCEHPIVILRDVCSDDVENLLSFMYNGEVNVNHDHLPEFLKTAHLLQIRGLADVTGGYQGGMNATAKSLATSYTSNNNNSNNNNNNNNDNNNKMNFQPIALSSSNNASNNSNNNSGSSSSGSSNNNANNNTILPSPFNIPTLAAAAAVVASTTPAANLIGGSNNSSSNTTGSNNNNNANNSNNNNNSSNSNNNNNNSSNNLSLSGLTSSNTNSNTPAIQELKASSASPANHHWDLTDSESNRKNHLTPPPQKRIKSADLFRAQHGISPERLLLDREFPVAGQHPLTRERRSDRNRDTSREGRDSLLGQALESSNGQQLSSSQKSHGDLVSLHAQSAGEDSNSSDTEPSDRGDVQHDGTMDSLNGSLDNPRSHSFPSAFLGLQGIPGLLPGPSGIGANDFVSRRSLEMRVRATDPRPCPKCGKIYRSAHTLRTHLEDKHTVCPGYRCVLCGTVAKSRNSLHSHMSRQHRGISTKDLPVLPMPSAFDPELASRLLAKAGVKISPAELRARASPTSGGSGSGSQNKLELVGAGGMNDECEDSDDDPEDLTTSSGGYGMVGVGGSNNGGNDLSRYHENLLSNFGHANNTISRIRNEAAAAAAVAALGQKDLVGGVPIPTSNAAGQSLLDTYLQFITENTFAGMGMSQEHAAAAALHAAKMAQLNVMGHGLEKLPPGLLPPQFGDLSKITAPGVNFGSATGVTSGLTIEPVIGRDRDLVDAPSPNENGPTALTTGNNAIVGLAGNNTTGANADINRRESSEPMDLGLDNNQSGSNNDAVNSEPEDNYSEDEGVHNT